MLVHLGQAFQPARFHLGNRLLQHVLIQLIAHFAHLARLFFTQQIAGATNVHILAGQRKARAQTVQTAQHAQPFFGLNGQLGAGLRAEIGIGAQLGAPDTAPDLVKLRQPIHIGTMHDQRIGGRNIKPGFDDRRGQKHIVFAIVKGVHPVIQLARRHLAVGDNIRNLLAQKFLDIRQIGDARHHIKALPAAIMLAQQGLAQCHRVELGNIGADGQPVDGRRADQAKLAHTGQRHLQRARDGRGRKRQHMHLGTQLFEPLFMGHAKLLFLINHDQAQIGEAHILGQHRMGADDDIDLAARQTFARIGHVLAGDKAGHGAQVDRQTAKTIGKTFEMLAG